MPDYKIDNTRDAVFSGLLWRFAERIGAQGVTLVVSIVLARILEPSVYGTVALVTVFTSILEVFIDGGLGVALVQKRDADDLDFSSVFFLNVCLCVIVYILIFLFAPYVALYYDDTSLVSVIRALGVIVIVSGIKNIQQAYVSRNMLFRKFFFSTLGGTIGAAIVGISMAYYGYGVWALVGQYLFNRIVDTVILWLTVGWHPKMIFSFQRLKDLYSFGWKIFASNFINTIYNNLRQLVIGKVFTVSDLAYFNKAEQLPSLIVINISTTIDSVLLPAMSNVQDKIQRVKAITRRSVSLGTYILAPIMIGFAACAEPLIGIVLTEKWLPCTRLLQIICVAYMFQPIQSSNVNAIKALGYSDVFLILEICKKIIGLILLFASLCFGIEAIALSLLIVALIFQFINTVPNRKLLDYSYAEQMKDFFPNIISALIMGVCIYCINLFDISWGMKLLIQIPTGVFVYVILSVLLRLESFCYLKSYISEKWISLQK